MKLTKTASSLCVAAALTGCMGENRRPTDRPLTTVRTEQALDPVRPAIEDEAFRRMGFTTYWDSFVRDEEITSLHIEGNFDQEVGAPQLYAFTRSNRLYQVDLHSGMVNWVFDVGRPLSFADGRPIAEWVYKADKDTGLKRYDEVFFVAGDHLISLDKDNGSELWTIRLPFAASTPPAVSGSHVFVGSWDDRIYGYRKDSPDAPDWYWRTDGDLLARPCTDSPSLFVPSSDGKMYTFEASTGERKWHFTSEQRLVRDPLLWGRGKLLYIPSEDYNLYVVNALDGLLEYRFCAGSPITSHPTSIGRTVFFTAEGQGLFALERKGRPRNAAEGNTRKTAHELLWQREGSQRVLCRGMDDFYVLEPIKDESGNLTTRTKVTKVGVDGKDKQSVELPPADWVLTDPYSPDSPIREEAQLGGMIVLGWRNGWIVALKEIATLPGGAQVEGVEGPGQN